MDHFGGRNGFDMFDKMEEKVKEFLEVNEGTKIAYQLYDKVENNPLILTIVTPLMQRIHTKVSELILSEANKTPFVFILSKEIYVTLFGHMNHF